MLQNDRAGIAALPAFKSLLPARHLSKTFGDENSVGGGYVEIRGCGPCFPLSIPKRWNEALRLSPAFRWVFG